MAMLLDGRRKIMRSIYMDEWGENTIQTERRGGKFTIVTRDRIGRVLRRRGHYPTRENAEIALGNMADYYGWKWIGKQEQKSD